MDIVLIIFCVVLVLSVAIHFFLWRDNKKHFDETIRRTEALNKKLMQLEANDEDIDKTLDETEKGLQDMGDEIDALRSVLFHKKNTTFEN